MFPEGVIDVAIIWALFALYVLYSFVFNYIIFPEKAKPVFGKDCNPSVTETVRYKYLVSIFLDNWSTNYDLKKAIIYIELITKQQTKMISFSLRGEDIINKRAHLLLHRKKVLRPLTRVRMIHDCPNTEARIHMSAIKIQDLKYGSTIYYSIDRNIHYEPMKLATVHNTIPLKLQICSEHIFAPNFIQVRTDTYSTKRITSYVGQQYETHGVILTPELNGWEDMAFVIFHMFSIFYFNILFAIKLKQNFAWSQTYILMASVFLSSGLSFNSTNISALFYRKFIKTNYNIYCSPQLIDDDKDSILWTLYKNLSLTYLVSISAMVSIFIPSMIERNAALYNHKYLSQLLDIDIYDQSNNPLVNEIAFLLIFFLVSLITSLTVWLSISGFIKYLHLKLCAVPTYTPYEKVVKFSDDITGSDDEPERIRQKPVQDTDDNQTYPGLNQTKLSLGTERLEDELKADLKNKKIMTGSIILTPTNNPLGFVDPEKYRSGTESKSPSKSNTGQQKK